MRLLIHESGGPARSIEFRKDWIRLGSDPRCDVSFDKAKHPGVSTLHAELITKGGRVWLVNRSKSLPTTADGKSVDKPIVLKEGNRFVLGKNGPAVELAIESSKEGMASRPSRSSSSTSQHAPTSTGRIEIVDGGIIGRVPSATFQLPHSLVSRRHAIFKLLNGKSYIADAGSANGTFVDGVRISSETELRVGSVVDIGPFTLVFDGKGLTSRSRANNIKVDVTKLSYVVSDANSNRQLHLLNEVTFSIDPGQFIAVLGPSGSGKSTLLKIVSGRNWPFSGQVNLNGRSLHREFAAFKEDLVVVPQATAFHETLTVRQTLEFSASLRLQSDTSKAERVSVVNESLMKVGLHDRSGTQVGSLSGGQLKRLGLACELISDPSLVFLDEVTSGLDEQADGEMMKLFRSLADTGKTLVCVTHNLSHVESTCHKVLVLTVGGRVAFFGSPKEACEYFAVKKLADVYAKLATKRPEQWHSAYMAHSRAANLNTKETVGVEHGATNKLSMIRRVGLRPVSQTIVLIKRYIAVWLGDLSAILALLGQAFLVMMLLCIVFGSIPEESGDPAELLTRKNEIRNLLFLIGISCFWLGANNAAKEIVKERRIFERERAFNLVPESFWASKIFVLSLIGLLQSSMLTLAVVVCCGVPGSALAYTAAALFLSFLGTSLGLAISANAKSEELAVALVPAVIIPQIILAGVVANLNSVSTLLAQGLITSYWGQQLFENFIPEADQVAAVEHSVLMCVVVLAAHLGMFLITSWVGCRFFKLARE